MVYMLISRKASVNKRNNKTDGTPLLISILHGYKRIVEILVDHGADVNMSNIDHLTPLMAASKKGWFDIAHLLIQAGASAKAKDCNGDSAISMANKSHTCMIRLLQTKEAIPMIVKCEDNCKIKSRDILVYNKACEIHPEKVQYLSDVPAGYTIECGFEYCCILLPRVNQLKVEVEKISGSLYPAMKENEDLCTSAVALKPEGLHFDSSHPCIIVFPFDGTSIKDREKGTLDLICGEHNKENTIEWKPVDSQKSNLKVHDKSISVSTVHSGFFAVKYSKMPEVPYLSDIPSGYTIGCGTEYCCILLPQENMLKVEVKKLDESLLPNMKENEDICTSAVALKPEGLHFDSSHPCIIVFPFDGTSKKDLEKGTFDLICGEHSKENIIEWKPVDSQKSNLRVYDKSISVSTVHSGQFAVKYSATPMVPYLSGLPPGYAVRIGTEYCCILLPKESQDKVKVKKISDNWYPDLEVNTDICSSAVELKPDGLCFDDKFPCIIVFPFDPTLKYDPEKGTFELIYGEFNEDNRIEWKPVDSKMSNIIVDDECIYVSVCHSGIFAVKYFANPEISISKYQSLVPDGYTIGYETEFCCIMLPQTDQKNVQAEEITDEILLPILKENESLCTSVVVLKPNDITFDSDKPCIIILPLDKIRENDEKMSTYTPFYGYSTQGNNSMDWRPMDPSLSKCTVGKESVSISVYHTGVFVVKCSTEYPASTTHIKPNEEATLSVPELNNFQLEITDSCVQEKDLEIKSTVHFCDNSYNSSEIYAAATACVKFEPHGQKFKHPLQVVVPIPDYDKIIAEYPDIQMNVWYSQNSTSKEKSEAPSNWRILHGSNIAYVEGVDNDGHPCTLAKFEIEHFSWYQINFDKLKEPFKKLKAGAEFAYNQMFRRPKRLRMRMKAMMTEPSKERDFSIVIVFFRFSDPLASQKKRYPYCVAFDDEILMKEGSVQILLVGKRFAKGGKQKIQKEGTLKLFDGDIVTGRFEYLLELKNTCRENLTKEDALGQVKLIQKEMDEKSYTLYMEKENDQLQLTLGQVVAGSVGEGHQSMAECTEIPSWNETIKMAYVVVIKYRNYHSGEMQEIRILTDLAPQWKMVADLLELAPQRVKAIENPGSGSSPGDCLREAITEWLTRGGTKRFPTTWKGMHDLLMDCEHGSTARELKEAIESSCPSAIPEGSEISQQDASTSSATSATPIAPPGGASATPPVKPQATPIAPPCGASATPPVQLQATPQKQDTSTSSAISATLIATPGGPSATPPVKPQATPIAAPGRPSATPPVQPQATPIATSSRPSATPPVQPTPIATPSRPSATPPVQPQATPQTPANLSQARTNSPRKMDKHRLSQWLLEQGMEQEDINILKDKGVSELLFQRIKPGDKYCEGLSEGGVDLVSVLQDELK